MATVYFETFTQDKNESLLDLYGYLLVYNYVSSLYSIWATGRDVAVLLVPVVTKDLLISISPRFTPYGFLSRCKFSTLTTRQPVVEFYSLTFPRFPLRNKEHKSCFDKNRTHDFRTTSRCAGPIGRRIECRKMKFSDHYTVLT